jgi:hypothetical protein
MFPTTSGVAIQRPIERLSFGRAAPSTDLRVVSTDIAVSFRFSSP